MLFLEKVQKQIVSIVLIKLIPHLLNQIIINNHLPEKQYPQICFDYIHQNPVKANLVKNAIDWEFSSAKDYAGLRNGKLINKDITKEYIELYET